MVELGPALKIFEIFVLYKYPPTVFLIYLDADASS